MKIETIVTGPYEENCYLIYNENHQVLVVDPGEDNEYIQQFITRHRLDVQAYICTHGHADHISALAKLYAINAAPIAMHADDWCWAFTDINQMPPYYFVPQKPDVTPFDLVKKNEYQFGDFQFQCIYTPGHTPGSTCILLAEKNMLFSGDTLFKGSCGRTDLQGGDSQLLQRSLQSLSQLPEGVQVFPGHGPSSTIGEENRTNPFMQHPISR